MVVHESAGDDETVEDLVAVKLKTKMFFSLVYVTSCHIEKQS